MGRPNVVIRKDWKTKRKGGILEWLFALSLFGLEKKKNLEQELARVNSFYCNYPSLLL